eukprot:8561821-Pyramimonas_sp.AAC.1
MPNWMFGTGGTGAFGSAPYGPTKRCTGWVKTQLGCFGTHADGGTGAFGGKIIQAKDPTICSCGCRNCE